MSASAPDVAAERRAAGVGARIVPPRELEDTMEQAGAMFGVIGDSAVAFDLLIDSDGPSWWVRAADERALERALARVLGAWPDATVLRGGVDPGVVHAFERCVRVPLVADGDPALPLRSVWRDLLSRQELDPLESVAAQAPRRPGLRVIARMTIRRAERSVARAIADRREDRMEARDNVREVRADRRESARAVDRMGGGAAIANLEVLALLAVVAFGAGGWWLWSRIEWWHIAVVLLGMLLLGAGAGWLFSSRRGLFSRLIGLLVRHREEPLPEEAVEEKLRYPLLHASLAVYAAAPPALSASEVEDAALSVAESYREFVGGLGGGGLMTGRPDDRTPASPEERVDSKEQLLFNAREASAIWHLPVRMAGAAGVERGHATALLPLPQIARRGIPVGVSGDEREVRQPLELALRNQLVIAKTRRGKSTLLRHIAAGLLARADDELPGGRPAIVVVDPHQDLAEAVIESLPEARLDDAIYLDFANLEHPLGLNLLDIHAFPNRDLQTEHVVTMMSRIWPQNWGPRMEGVLRNALLALHTVNRQRAPHAQYTLLDISPLLTDHGFRESILAQANDPALWLWWRDNYDRVSSTLQQQSANPVLSKIGRFISSGAARNVFGQARTTFDPGGVVRDGGVLIINTATGTLGEGSSSLIGATLINLLMLRIEAQIALPEEQRRRVTVIVDESSTLGAIDYSRALSELGKFGGNMILATQSLSKLDAVDEQLARVIFANIDGLTAFQVSAEDAARIEPELGSEIGVEDLISLDDYHTYARWWEQGRKSPVFSFKIAAPPAGEDVLVRRTRRRIIAERSARRFGRPLDTVEREIYASIRGHLRLQETSAAVVDLREAVADSERAVAKPVPETSAAKPKTRGGRRRGAKPPRRKAADDDQQQLFAFDEGEEK